jgi:ERCC4-related helicase
VRWKQDLTEDRNRLATLTQLRSKSAPRDDKLLRLRDLIANKCKNPINAGNRKVIIFTAFADTATYLYEQLSGWAKSELGIESAWSQALAATNRLYLCAATSAAS